MLSLRLKAERAAQDFPALLAEAERAVAGFMHGETAQRRAGSGDTFWQFREYQPGDMPGAIDWRRSARSESIYVREREHQSPQSTYIWCSRAPGMDFTSGDNPTKCELAQVLSLALAILLARGGEQIAADGSKTALRGSPGIESLARALTQEATAPLPDAASLPRHARFIAAGDFLAPPEEIENALAPYFEKTRDGVILQILDPAELDFPYQGRIDFIDPATGAPEPVDNAAALQAAYQKRIQNHIAGLRDLCARHGWQFFLCPSQLPPEDCISPIWNALHKTGGP